MVPNRAAGRSRAAGGDSARASVHSPSAADRAWWTATLGAARAIWLGGDRDADDYGWLARALVRP